MQSDNIPSAAKSKGPVAFISSFYQESEQTELSGSLLRQLRQELADLNDDVAFRSAIGADGVRQLTWVAERSPEQFLTNPDWLAVTDRLIEVLKESDLYICILGDKRQGKRGHGSPIIVHGEETAVSFFEIELYAAVMYGKRAVPFVLEGFEPGERLRFVLEILGDALPGWEDIPKQKAKEIVRDVRELIRKHVRKMPTRIPPLRKRLVQEFSRHRAKAFSTARARPGLLFLDGMVEPRPLPDVQRVESLVNEYKNVPNIQRRLNRMWLVVRELMPASYRPEEVATNGILREYLPYWDCVLGDWASAASWHGWHGHLFAGTIAPLNSQTLVRSQSFRTGPSLQSSVAPDGALASAYYSIAGIMGFGFQSWTCLRRAGQHVKRALETRDGHLDNLLAIRGSIRLRLGLWPSAVSDFKEMLRLRRHSGAPPNKIADALMHLGYAYAFCPITRKGQDLLIESVRILSDYKDDPNLPRAKRKLAWAFKIAGKFNKAREMLLEAEMDASRLAAFDQIGR